MKISLIWAMARNRVIGNGLQLPWQLPKDLAYFKKITSGKPVIMGLNTYNSIGKPLPGRKNIVMSYEPLHIEGCVVACSTHTALAAAAGHDEVFIIGGAQIYQQFLPFADALYMTYIDAEVAGDVYFPEYDTSMWQLINAQTGACDEQNNLAYEFRVYQRSV